METKQQIRTRHLAERDLVLPEERELHSLKISRILIAYFSGNLALCKANGIYGYYPHGSEVSLMELYGWLLEQKIPLAFPAVSGGRMEFYRVDAMERFLPGAFGIMEPAVRIAKAGFSSAACLVPGSVFDRAGNRYGYGKGYYDRYFSVNKDLYRIGTAYASQVEAWIPAECCDVKMQALVTEKGMFFI